MKFDITFNNPMGNPGILYKIEADTPEEACGQAPHLLAASSQWHPEQFTVLTAKLSKHED